MWVNGGFIFSYDKKKLTLIIIIFIGKESTLTNIW